jgi:hypothetical protein
MYMIGLMCAASALGIVSCFCFKMQRIAIGRKREAIGSRNHTAICFALLYGSGITRIDVAGKVRIAGALLLLFEIIIFFVQRVSGDKIGPGLMCLALRDARLFFNLNIHRTLITFGG